MKVLVIFGSKSDANIYEPLKARLLQDQHEVDFRMISVHRSPELLDKELAGLSAHAIVAGAGLAAHLPGILASKTLVPVFGIPCAAALGGIDAFLAMAQMPFGIPVMATAADQYQSVAEFLVHWEQLDLQFSFDRFNIVAERSKRSLPQFAHLLGRAENIAEKTKIDLNLVDRPVEHEVNICLVDVNASDPEGALPYGPIPKNSIEVRLQVPVLGDQAYRDFYSAPAVLRRAHSVPGSLWCGVNNIGNAMLFSLQLANATGTHSAFLTNAKKGYIHA